ncbi:MAG: sulfatase-like hydrolase/transferase, partial [Actinobacteria bacterium]|nr:sulfatase-like hydrolase/transferase [Actinomycetota bacterium]
MNVLGFLRVLLDRRGWVYSLSLLIPFVVYDLALKAYDVASRPVDHGLAQTLDLMRSDVFFGLGYALLWIGLFAVVRRRQGPVRWAVVFLFHAATVLVVLVITCAHRYFQVTGTILDYTTVAEWVSKLDEIVPILVHGISLSAWILLATVLLYAAFAPWLLTRAVERWRGWPGTRPAGTARISFSAPLGLWVLALGFGSLSLLADSGAGETNASLTSDPFVNVALTGVKGTSAEEDYPDVDSVTEHPPADASLSQKPQTEKRNVVLVHLESTRAQSVTPYNEDLKTTPFLEELAKSSLLAEQAHVVLPRSSKGSVAVNCGIEPPLYPGPEFKPGGIPVQCLPNLLKDKGYSTVLFSSTSSPDFGDLVKNFGYQEYYSSGSMDKEGFEETNTFGYEDDIMLKPSEEWLRERKDEPFMAEYFTGTGHYGYECLGTHYGQEDFS